MVDPKNTELTVETETSLRGRKAWVAPRLETSSIAEDTLTGSGNTTADGGGALGSCVS